MGALLSSNIIGGAAAYADESQSSSSERSRVKEFISSDQWKLYFNSAKEVPTKLVVIVFSATWCGPCKMMEPILNAVSSKYTDVDFVKIDICRLNLQDVAQKFQVEAMPTFVFLKNGKEVDKIIGADKAGLAKKIEKHRRHKPKCYNNIIKVWEKCQCRPLCSYKYKKLLN